MRSLAACSAPARAFMIRLCMQRCKRNRQTETSSSRSQQAAQLGGTACWAACGGRRPHVAQVLQRCAVPCGTASAREGRHRVAAAGTSEKLPAGSAVHLSNHRKPVGTDPPWCSQGCRAAQWGGGGGGGGGGAQRKTVRSGGMVASQEESAGGVQGECRGSAGGEQGPQKIGKFGTAGRRRSRRASTSPARLPVPPPAPPPTPPPRLCTRAGGRRRRAPSRRDCTLCCSTCARRVTMHGGSGRTL